MPQKSRALKEMHTDLYYETIYNYTSNIFVVVEAGVICDYNDAFAEFFLDNSLEYELIDVDGIGALFQKIDKYGFVYDGYLGKKWYELILADSNRYSYVGVNKSEKLHIFKINVKIIDTSKDVMLVTMTEITNLVTYKLELEKEFSVVAEDNNKNRLLLEQYQVAIDESNMVSKTDLNGKIIYVNDSFCKKLKYDRNELIGRDHSMVRSQRVPDEKFEELWKTIQSGQIWKGVIEDIDKFGEGHYFNSTIIPLHDKNGTVVEYLAIRQDVSDIFRAKLEATRALEVRTTFLNQMSHELRTPLNAIINFIGQVLQDYDDILSDESFRLMAKNFLTRAQNNSNHLLEIVNTLLNVSKLESGKEVFTKEQFDLTDLTRGVYEDTKSLLLSKEIKYEYNSLGDSMPVVTDRQKLRQILINLISNAVKFTSHGSVKINLRENDTHYMVDVADTGRGIPEDKLNSVFEAFVQVDSYDKGTGLGLKLVKDYCDIMQIGIAVDSEVGIGTTFTLKIKKKSNANAK